MNRRKRINWTFVFTMISVISVGACSQKPEKSIKFDESLEHFSNSIEYDKKATQIVNKGGPYSFISGDDAENMITFYQEALNEAKQVDINLLDSRFPGWGTRYRDQYIMGMELVIKGHKNVDPLSSIKGQQLVETWKIWFNQNIAEIRKRSAD